VTRSAPSVDGLVRWGADLETGATAVPSPFLLLRPDAPPPTRPVPRRAPSRSGLHPPPARVERNADEDELATPRRGRRRAQRPPAFRRPVLHRARCCCGPAGPSSPPTANLATARSGGAHVSHLCSTSSWCVPARVFYRASAGRRPRSNGLTSAARPRTPGGGWHGGVRVPGREGGARRRRSGGLLRRKVTSAALAWCTATPVTHAWRQRWTGAGYPRERGSRSCRGWLAILVPVAADGRCASACSIGAPLLLGPPRQARKTRLLGGGGRLQPSRRAARSPASTTSPVRATPRGSRSRRRGRRTPAAHAVAEVVGEVPQRDRGAVAVHRGPLDHHRVRALCAHRSRSEHRHRARAEGRLADAEQNSVPSPARPGRERRGGRGRTGRPAARAVAAAGRGERLHEQADGDGGPVRGQRRYATTIPPPRWWRRTARRPPLHRDAGDGEPTRTPARRPPTPPLLPDRLRPAVTAAAAATPRAPAVVAGTARDPTAVADPRTRDRAAAPAAPASATTAATTNTTSAPQAAASHTPAGSAATAGTHATTPATARPSPRRAAGTCGATARP
jgi:hypothetical protein